MSRSDLLTLAVRFNARSNEKAVFVALATTEFIANFQLSLTRQEFLILAFRALKHTAKVIYRYAIAK